jgi:hypothetical protein
MTWPPSTVRSSYVREFSPPYPELIINLHRAVEPVATLGICVP